MVGVKTKLSAFFTNIHMHKTLNTVTFSHKDQIYVESGEKCTVYKGTVDKRAPEHRAMEENVICAICSLESPCRKHERKCVTPKAPVLLNMMEL